ncbi:MarR family transcriptional regulator [Halogeometricum borinquense]|uniref:MarR family transcriptional regulator n=1 Tax=Halogeometricum borinquense TaxID=60847 RepID=A0A6C0UGF5_9EURY|nr:MarR family transcriptional regulator [Halogeometricum borinquense]
MVNENYEPNTHEDKLLAFVKLKPCGLVTNRYVREETSMPAERVDSTLNNLKKTGWVKRLTRGFYELVEDPRE